MDHGGAVCICETTIGMFQDHKGSRVVTVDDVWRRNQNGCVTYTPIVIGQLLAIKIIYQTFSTADTPIPDHVLQEL